MTDRRGGSGLERLAAAFIIATLSPVSLVYPQAAETMPSAAVASVPIRVPDGFVVEPVYRVPVAQGSWVAMATDPRGRLITSDQGGQLYRV